MLLRISHLAEFEIPLPQITEQLGKALHTTLKSEYFSAVEYLEQLELFTPFQKNIFNRLAVRIGGSTLGSQLSALNSAKVYGCHL